MRSGHTINRRAINHMNANSFFSTLLYASRWLAGFSGDFIHSLRRICLSCDSRRVGFSCLILGILVSSNEANAAFIRFSGCLSTSGSFTLWYNNNRILTLENDRYKQFKKNEGGVVTLKLIWPPLQSLLLLLLEVYWCFLTGAEKCEFL